jgi:hypothetical protein
MLLARAPVSEKGCYLRLADEDLISLVAAGDAFAFSVLYDRHSRAAYSLAHTVTRNTRCRGPRTGGLP